MTPDTDQPKSPNPKPSAAADPKPAASVAKPEMKDATKAGKNPYTETGREAGCQS